MGRSDTNDWGATLYFCTVALNVTATEETCSNVTISWTAMDNRTADITILYSSIVHSGVVDYVSPPHTTTLTNLVADTEYTITVTAKYSDNTTTSGTVIANTSSGKTSNNGIIHHIYIVDQQLTKLLHTHTNLTLTKWIILSPTV